MRRLTGLLIATVAATVAAPDIASAQRSSFGIDWSCGYSEGEDFIQKIKRANQEDLSCMAGAGFWKETLPRIGGRMDEDRQRLRRLLSFIMDDDEAAEAFILNEVTRGNDEAVLWALVARGDEGLRDSTRRSRNIAVNLLISLPPWVKEQFAPSLADALLAEGDSRAAMTLATALSTIAHTDDERAQAAIIRGRVVERYGPVDEAVAFYQEAAELGNDQIAAEADLRRIALMWRSGYVETKEAVAVLKELVTVWRGQRLGAGITMALARAYYFDKQLPQALRLLVSVANSNGPDDVREEAERRIVSVADDLFVRQLHPASIGDLMDVYEGARPFVSSPDQFWLGDLRLSEELVRVGLFAKARELMGAATPEAVAQSADEQALLSSAAMMVLFGEREVAYGFLEAVSQQDLTPDQTAEFERLQALTVDVQQLAAMIRPGTRRDVLEIIGERAWEEEAYGLYTVARSYSDEPSTWKDPAATYLAKGTLLAPSISAQSNDPRYRALSFAPKPSLYHADDLRPLLGPSAEVVGLAATLTQIGQETSQVQPETGGSVNDAGAKDETPL